MKVVDEEEDLKCMLNAVSKADAAERTEDRERLLLEAEQLAEAQQNLREKPRLSLTVLPAPGVSPILKDSAEEGLRKPSAKHVTFVNERYELGLNPCAA